MNNSVQLTCSTLTPQAFQGAIRQWCEAMGLVETGFVGLFSQGHVPALAQWSVVGVGQRQQVTLHADGDLVWVPAMGSEQRFTSGQWAEVLEQARQQSVVYATPSSVQRRPFNGGLVGLLRYDAASVLDPYLQVPTSSPSDEVTVPWMTWRECEHWAVWHHPTQSLQVLSQCDLWQANAQDVWAHVLSVPSASEAGPLELSLAITGQPWQPSFSQQDFTQQVEALQCAITQGEFYQANLSLRLKTQTALSPWQTFQQISELNPSPFAAYWHTQPDVVVVSNSPERLVQVVQSPDSIRQTISTRPIAGTRGRGTDDASDETIGTALIENEKERAEHLMLVDLLRNDIGKVAMAGSVCVDELMVLERYSHVTHLVSNIVGQLPEEITPWQVLQALFPGGTITGCPKVRCCQWLAKSEPVSRGVYTGSMGYVDAATGQMDMNILIRTATFLRQTQFVDPAMWQVHVHAGAGIVLDSVAEHEYRETLRKAQAWQKVLGVSA